MFRRMLQDASGPAESAYRWFFSRLRPQLLSCVIVEGIDRHGREFSHKEVLSTDTPTCIMIENSFGTHETPVWSAAQLPSTKMNQRVRATFEGNVLPVDFIHLNVEEIKGVQDPMSTLICLYPEVPGQYVLTVDACELRSNAPLVKVEKNGEKVRINSCYQTLSCIADRGTVITLRNYCNYGIELQIKFA